MYLLGFNSILVLKILVPSTRFERMTCRLGGGRSIQLSYEGDVDNIISFCWDGV